MTVNTQELRELLAGLPTEPGCKHLAVPYSPKRIGFGHSGGPAWFLASSGSCTGPGEVLQYLRSMSELLNALPALLDEIDALKHDIGEYVKISSELATEIHALRAELQARQWQPIETAPKDGTEIIVFHPQGGVCAAFCPGDGFAWHCMDGMNTVIGKKSRQSIPAMTSFYEPPTHWMPLPPAPPQGDGA